MKQRRVTDFQKVRENETAELQQAARRVFGTPEGERILALILDTYCGVDQPIAATDPMQLAMVNGARNVGVRIKALLYADIRPQHPDGN